tara:strand:- start:7792 stop:8178 length:387 start_codon:yes stop_codon:yes gene_type:complete
MFGWLSKLAGKSDLLDKAAAGIDALVLTDEERIKYNLKKQELYLELEKEVNKQCLPRALTRRYIALLVTIPYIVIVVIKCLIEFAGAFGIINPVDLSSVNITLEALTMPFTSIIIFYYGTHVLSAIKK